MKNALIDQLQVWGFEDGITLFKDKSLGFGFRFEPKDIGCMNDDDINQTKVSIKNFLNSLPPKIDLQFVQLIGKEIEKEITNHGQANDLVNISVKSIAEERVQKFLKLNADGHLPRQKNLLFVRVPFVDQISSRMKLFDLRVEKSKDETVGALNRAISYAKFIQDEIQRNLLAAGFDPVRLAPSEITDLIFETWNPDRTNGIGEFDEQDIRDKVLLSELVKDVRGFRLGTISHRVISLKILPEQTFSGMAKALTDLPFSSSLALSMHVPDQTRELEWLKLNRRIAYAMVVGKKGVSDVESEAKLKDIEELLSEVVQDGEKILFASLSIILRSHDESELDSQVSHVLSCIRELSGSEGFMETYASFDIFSESTIPNAKNNERSKRIKSSNVADLLPVFGDWRGFDKSSVLLRNRGGALFKFDPFSSALTNANQVISGGSGSGKSHLTNLMVGQMLLKNPKVFILDIGASYKKTCELLDGQYISLSMSSGITINPLDLPQGAKEPSNEKIKFLVSLVQIMAQDNQNFGKLERAEVELAIQELYKKVSRPRLSDLKALLLENPNPDIARIAKILSLWTGDSPYGRLIDRVTNIELEKRIVCFDLKGLEVASDLQAVSLFTITDLVWREVQKDRSEMKFLVFDETWKLLENEVGCQFVAEVFRTFRKYYASAIAISQNIDDFAKSNAATAILPNASIKWVLRQTGADFKRLSEVLRLNDREVALVQSLTQAKGQFSEAFLMCEDKRSVVVVESTPLEYWLATTDPRDFALLKKQQEITKTSGIELLQYLARQFPQGASNEK